MVAIVLDLTEPKAGYGRTPTAMLHLILSANIVRIIHLNIIT